MFGEKSVLTNFDPKMAKFGQIFDQIWSLSKFQNHSQVFMLLLLTESQIWAKKVNAVKNNQNNSVFPSIFKNYI